LQTAFQEFSEEAMEAADLFAFVKDGLTTHRKTTLADVKALINAPDFEFTDTSVTAGADSGFAHGLGAVPKRIEAYIQFTASTKGFATGDIVNASNLSQVWRNDVDGGPTDMWGMYVYADATDIHYVVGRDGLQLVRYPDGSNASNGQGINLGAVDVILRAWI
jgi:hypothetical protein